MEKKIELSMEEMEEVTGGVYRTVNTGVADLKKATGRSLPCPTERSWIRSLTRSMTR